MNDPKRDDLIRMVPLERADVSSDGNTLAGYAAVFNEWTEIDSWEGKFRERIHPSAFTKTLAENGHRVKVLFNHGFDPQIGDKPLGKPVVMEPRRKGLWTETPLDETTYNGDLKASLKSGALDGMSFRFTVQEDEWRDGDDGMEERTIKQVELLEFGPVTFPAYEATTAGVRNSDMFKLWRTAHRDGEQGRTDAVPSDTEDRSTDEAAASLDEDRDTSESDAVTERLETLTRDMDSQKEAIQKWAPLPN